MLVALIPVVAVAGVGHAQQGPASVRPQTITPRSSAEPTNQSAEEIIIKEKIRAAGVSGVHDLVRNPDGSWQGKGTKGKSEIAVMVDTDGNVRFQ